MTHVGETHQRCRRRAATEATERRTPILIGGNGPNKTLPLAARYADEWNGVFINLPTFVERMQRLDKLIELEGREPGEVKRSIMGPIYWAEDDAGVAKLLVEFNGPERHDTEPGRGAEFWHLRRHE